MGKTYSGKSAHFLLLLSAGTSHPLPPCTLPLPAAWQRWRQRILLALKPGEVLFFLLLLCLKCPVLQHTVCAQTCTSEELCSLSVHSCFEWWQDSTHILNQEPLRRWKEPQIPKTWPCYVFVEVIIYDLLLQVQPVQHSYPWGPVHGCIAYQAIARELWYTDRKLFYYI